MDMGEFPGISSNTPELSKPPKDFKSMFNELKKSVRGHRYVQREFNGNNLIK